jgi:hypothetical protein
MQSEIFGKRLTEEGVLDPCRRTSSGGTSGGPRVPLIIVTEGMGLTGYFDGVVGGIPGRQKCGIGKPVFARERLVVSMSEMLIARPPTYRVLEGMAGLMKI